MFISKKGLDFIKQWESCKLLAYKDTANIWTIGWGSIIYEDGTHVKKGDVITQDRADYLLGIECDGIGIRLESIIKVKLKQNEIDSISSFCYNVGVQGFLTSSLLRAINNKKEVIENFFTRWNKIHLDGKLVAVKGLTNRRLAEYQLFIS